MQNPDSTITDGHCNKSKSEVDPDSNSTPKVDLKTYLLLTAQGLRNGVYHFSGKKQRTLNRQGEGHTFASQTL